MLRNDLRQSDGNTRGQRSAIYLHQDSVESVSSGGKKQHEALKHNKSSLGLMYTPLRVNEFVSNRTFSLNQCGLIDVELKRHEINKPTLVHNVFLMTKVVTQRHLNPTVQHCHLCYFHERKLFLSCSDI